MLLTYGDSEMVIIVILIVCELFTFHSYYDIACFLSILFLVKIDWSMSWLMKEASLLYNSYI